MGPSSSTFWPLKMGPISCPETSVQNYHPTLRNIPEERRSHQHRGGSLKSGPENVFFFLLNTEHISFPKRCLVPGFDYGPVAVAALAFSYGLRSVGASPSLHLKPDADPFDEICVKPLSWSHPCSCHKCRLSRGITPLILNFGTTWSWDVNFTPRPLYLWERTLVPIE
jgi:hypothetical protein